MRTYKKQCMPVGNTAQEGLYERQKSSSSVRKIANEDCLASLKSTCEHRNSNQHHISVFFAAISTAVGLVGRTHSLACVKSCGSLCPANVEYIECLLSRSDKEEVQRWLSQFEGGVYNMEAQNDTRCCSPYHCNSTTGVYCH